MEEKTHTKKVYRNLNLMVHVNVFYPIFRNGSGLVVQPRVSSGVLCQQHAACHKLSWGSHSGFVSVHPSYFL